MADRGLSAASELFCELAAISSPSGRERVVQDRVIAELRSLGLEPREDAAGAEVGSDAGNVYARLPGTAPGTPLFFCAHVDTVPATAPIRPVLRDGALTNAEATILGADNKATVAALLAAVRAVVAEGLPHAGVELVITVQEETGLRGAKAFDCELLTARHGYVFDHGGRVGGLIMAAPSQKTIVASFSGRAAHSGIEPERGISAIAAAAQAVAGMRLGRIDADTTANVGLISGGVARNIVAPSCRIDAEARSLVPERCAEQAETMLEACAQAAAASGCGLETDVIDEYTAYGFSGRDDVVRLAQAALAGAGIAAYDVRSGGGADAHVFNARGLQCLNLCSGMEAIHTPEERIDPAQIDAMTAVTLGLIRAALA